MQTDLGVGKCLNAFSFLLYLACILPMVSGAVTKLESSNIDSILAGSELVIVNFYADWCRFSQILMPVFDEASEKFKELPPGIVAWAKVDCDREAAIAQKYHVSKYPTLKLFRNGELVKKEYRGQRSAAALSEYIQTQLDSRLATITSDEDFTAKKAEKEGRIVVAYFTEESGPEFTNYKKAASTLRDDCAFHLGVGEAFAQHMQGQNRLFHYSSKDEKPTEYTGGLANFDFLKQWLTEHCIPMVRELTFKNAEEMTEEGLPFLILFRNADDEANTKLFTEQALTQLSDQKSTVNILVADGKKFAHPLHHLGKSEKDLPVLAIDSFRHMYLFPDFAQISLPNKLRDFVLDLHSGKLHREFHHGPDPTEKESTNGEQKDGTLTEPPPSVFKNLKPSDSRYTLLNRDEL